MCPGVALYLVFVVLQVPGVSNSSSVPVVFFFLSPLLPLGLTFVLLPRESLSLSVSHL